MTKNALLVFPAKSMLDVFLNPNIIDDLHKIQQQDKIESTLMKYSEDESLIN